jgi:ABC-type amino acid transport substrate-binding protein
MNARTSAASRSLRRAATGAICLALLVSSCARPAPEPQTRAITRIVDAGTLRVGISGGQPPLNMRARGGEPIGLDVAIARVLARSMQVQAQFVVLPFGELLDALGDGRVDLVISGMTITPERSRQAVFVGPYFVSGKMILTRSPELAGVETPEQLDDPARRIAALRGSTSEAFARASLPRSQLVLVDQLAEGVQAVRGGEVDALVADRETCSFAVLRYPDAGLLASDRSFTVEPLGIAVPHGEPNLVNLLETYLAALRESGGLQKAQDYWFRDPSWIERLP